MTVLVQGIAGVLVALTTKHAGCIAGSISGIAAIAVTHMVELVQRGNSTSTGELSFCLGFALIAAGVSAYTLLPTTVVEIVEPEYTRIEEAGMLMEMDRTPVEEKTDPLFQDEVSSEGASTLSPYEIHYHIIEEEDDDDDNPERDTESKSVL